MTIPAPAPFSASIGGDRALLRKLQNRFIANLDGFAPAFRQSLAEQKSEDAIRLAHTLKATAGTIGAVRVQKAAKALETACRTVPLTVEPLLEALLSVMARARESLDAIAGAEVVSPEPQQVPATPSQQGLVSVLRDLHRTLTDSDTAAASMLPRLTEMCPQPEFAETLQEIVAAVRCYDYPAGLIKVELRPWPRTSPCWH